jgi:4-hydroxybenzoate polyprenyltransferase
MENKSFINSIILLVRSRIELIGLWVWGAVVASIVVGRGFPPLKPAFMSIAATGFTAIAVYIYNDVVDTDADRFNTFKADRPMVSGKVSRSDAMKLVYVSSFVGLTLSYLNSLMSFIFNSLYFLIFVLYSYPKVQLKKYFLMKETIISLGLIMVALSVNYAILSTYSPMILLGFAFFAVFAFFTMPTGFDSTDVEADRLQGVKSLASALSFRHRMQLAMFGMFTLMVTAPFTYANYGYSILLPVSVIVTGLLFTWLMYPLMTSIDPITDMVDSATLLKARKIIYTFIFLICGCVILGSLRFPVLL